MKNNKLDLTILTLTFITFLFVGISYAINSNEYSTLKHFSIIAESLMVFLLNFTFLIFLTALFDIVINKRKILIYIIFCLLLVKFSLIKQLHAFIRNNGFNFNFFLNKTSPEQVVTDQFTQVYLILIGFLFCCVCFFYFVKNWHKLFMLFFMGSFYIFCITIHYFIIDRLHITALNDYGQQVWVVLNNDKHYNVLCKDLKFVCKKTRNEKEIILEEKSIIEKEMNDLINKSLVLFNKSNEYEKYILLTKFNLNGVVTFSFGFKKIENEVLVVVNDKNVHNLTMRSALYFIIPYLIFLMIWSIGIYWLYKKHKNKRLPKLSEIKVI